MLPRSRKRKTEEAVEKLDARAPKSTLTKESTRAPTTTKITDKLISSCPSPPHSQASRNGNTSTSSADTPVPTSQATTAKSTSAPAVVKTKTNSNPKAKAKAKPEPNLKSKLQSKPNPKPKPKPKLPSPVESGRIIKRQSTRIEEIREKKRKDGMLLISLRSLFPNPGLTYYDVNLSAEDIKSLKGTEWITDNIICFWEEYLERETLQRFPQAHVLLMRPSMVHLLNWTKEEKLESIRHNLPNFRDYTHVFMPINGNPHPLHSGTHWSLLLISFPDKVAFHYDSLSTTNDLIATKIVVKLNRLLRIPRSEALTFTNLQDCPQQENGSDCGVFLCLLMRFLLVKRLLRASSEEKICMSLSDKLVNSYGGRKQMAKIIENLRKEGERRRLRDSVPLPKNSPPRIEDRV